MMSVYRKFAQARNNCKALAVGKIADVSSGKNPIALWTMAAEGESVLVAHNFGGSEVTFSPGSMFKLDNVLVSNGTFTVSGTEVTLGPWSSVVFKQ